MRKLNYLVQFTILLVLTCSCSKDDEISNSYELGIHKVTFEQSGAYQDYNVAVSGGTKFGILTIDSKGNEEQTISSQLDVDFYSFQTKQKTELITFAIGGQSESEAKESMQTKITLYFNDKTVYTETIEFKPEENLKYLSYVYDTRQNPRLTTPAK